MNYKVMRFKKGDNVKVKPREYFESHFSGYVCGERRFVFNECREHGHVDVGEVVLGYCGKVLTITGVEEEGYRIDGTGILWLDKWFE